MLYELGDKKVGITPAKLSRAVDGDTVELQVRPTGPVVDVGFGITVGGGPVLSTWVFAKVRLVALYAPWGLSICDNGELVHKDTISRLIDEQHYTKINTPELRGQSREAGLAAKQRTHELLFDKRLMLITPEKPKSFDRWIGAVLYEAESNPKVYLDVGSTLLDEKVATRL